MQVAVAALAVAYVLAFVGRLLLRRHPDAVEFDRTMAERGKVPEDCADVLWEGGEVK